jgi:squalene-hopene/tetraprenyl-beta-curcumene cyclase
MLLPNNFRFNIYELSSWGRSSTVPLLIIFDRKPVFQIEQPINLDELYLEGVNNVKWELPKNGDCSDIFNILDNGFKIPEMLNLIPFRNEGIKGA